MSLYFLQNSIHLSLHMKQYLTRSLLEVNNQYSSQLTTVISTENNLKLTDKKTTSFAKLVRLLLTSRKYV